MNPDNTGSFQSRHIGPRPHERDQMLRLIGTPSLDALMEEAIPSSIRLQEPPSALAPESEHEFLARLRGVARNNRPMRSLIGLGYSDCVTPSVILRNVFENPSWYTPYTPYQAEIAQGRLEALLTFQTLVDGSHRHAGGERVAPGRAHGRRRGHDDAAAACREGRDRCSRCRPGASPQTIDVLHQADPLDVDLHVGTMETMTFSPRVFGVLLQYPGPVWSRPRIWSPFIARRASGRHARRGRCRRLAGPGRC